MNDLKTIWRIYSHGLGEKCMHSRWSVEYPEIRKKLEKMEGERFSARFWDKDPSLWWPEPEHQRVIKNRLGWLDAPEWTQNHIAELEDFGREIVNAGFSNVVLMGMGGSSLCPEVFRLTFGSAPGFPALHVLDTTDADTICEIENSVNLQDTLFIVASKSGGTIEVMSFYNYFHQKLRDLKGEKAGENLIAITDPGSPLQELGEKNNFRRIFLNPPDIGGRFSALSYFGLVPAALIGMDLSRLTQNSANMAQACGPDVPQNPGLQLGVILGEIAKLGRDKLTFFLSEPLVSFGYWAEQLIAESTGKEGTGILPVEGEPVGRPDSYGDDRLFVAITLKGDNTKETALDDLEAAGHPVVRIELNDLYELGGQFFLWETATSVAGAILQINPFDEPNVTESKTNTARILKGFRSTGSLPSEEQVAEEGDIKLYATPEYCGKLISSASTLSSILQAHLGKVKPGDYLALTAYIQATDNIERILGDIRRNLRVKLKVATTIGYGPRFLHSTGQLHKGGADNGVFIQITADGDSDLAIPGEPYSFNILKTAQAMGDFQSLATRGRRLIRVHLTGELEKSLESLKQLIICL
jgi:glucose-6-phosphate isomerase